MPKITKRAIRIEGDIAYVPLTQGYEAIIDAADVPLVEDLKWSAQVIRRKDGTIRAVYAIATVVTGKLRSHVRMHRRIAATPDGLETDHEDRDGLNNRRSNLRAATPSQNQYNRRINRNNTSGFKGVRWRKDTKKWRAEIKHQGKMLNLGHFSNQQDAVAAYLAASAQFGGAFASEAASLKGETR